MTVYVGAFVHSFRRYVYVGGSHSLSSIRDAWMHRCRWTKRVATSRRAEPGSTLLVRANQLPCNRDSRTAIIIAFALSSAATSIYNHAIPMLVAVNGKEKGANRNNSRVRVAIRWIGVRVFVERAHMNDCGKSRLHQDHIVRWFYNQRRGFVTGSSRFSRARILLFSLDDVRVRGIEEEKLPDLDNLSEKGRTKNGTNRLLGHV